VPRYRAAIIGCGRIARGHARGYRAQADVNLVACADISAEALERFGDEFAIAGRYQSLDEMLDRERPDIVSVCTHEPLHAAVVLAAARRAPRGILCEKPIALTLPDADAMIAACAAAGTVLIIGHQRRFSPQYVAAKRALDAGAIGEIRTVTAHGHPGSSLLVDGTHTVDLVRFFLDEAPVAWVIGQIDDRERREAWSHPAETAALGWIGFANGVHCLLTAGGVRLDGRLVGLGGAVTGPNYHHITLFGTAGRLQIAGDHVDPGMPMVTVQRGAAREEVPLPWPLEGDATHQPPFSEEIRVLLRCLETGAVHPLAAPSARATLEVLLAIYESARRRAVVPLPLAVGDNPLFALREAQGGTVGEAPAFSASPAGAPEQLMNR
jgi:UDP-N-acetyl-2-amino-2-deoxyglucuronate dehydrogenase